MNSSRPLQNAVWVLIASTGLLVLVAALHPDAANAVGAISRSFTKTTARRPDKLSDFREPNPYPSADEMKSVNSDSVSVRMPEAGAERSPQNNRSPGTQRLSPLGPPPRVTQSGPRNHAATIHQSNQRRLKTGRVARRHVSVTDRTTHGRPTTRNRRSNAFAVSSTPPPKSTRPWVELDTIEEIEDYSRTHRPAKSPQLDNNQASPDAANVEARMVALRRTIDRLAQAQTDHQTKVLERAAQLLEQMQQSNRLRELERQIQQLQSNGSAATTSPHFE